MDEEIIWKIIFIVVFITSCLIVGMMPIYLSYLRNNIQIVSLGNVFASGIFLSVAIIHILPEGTQDIQNTIGDSFPLGYILCVVGYIMILVIEKVIFKHPHTPEDLEQNFLMENFLKIRDQQRSLQNSGYNQEQVQNIFNKFQKILDETEKRPEEMPLIQKNYKKKKYIISGIILAVALTVHSLFQGIAIGLQSQLDAQITLGLAILIHKMPAALALGFSLKQVKRKLATILMVIFSLASPIGILIGILLQSFEIPMLDGIFSCICGGTFLYISCSEVVVREFSDNKALYWKTLAFILGFGTFTVLTQLITED